MMSEQKLSTRIYAAWRVGGIGWTSEDVRQWHNEVTILEAKLEAMERLLQTAVRLEPTLLYRPEYQPFGAREEKEE